MQLNSTPLGLPAEPPLKVIAVINDDLARMPELRHLASPVSVEHVRYACDNCLDSCWIGPGQLKIVTAEPNTSVICYRCIITKPQFAGIRQQVEQGIVHVADPNADSKPRMWS